MIDRGIAHQLFQSKIGSYKGPAFYLSSHHELLKPDSDSTPCGTEFDSSINFKELIPSFRSC